MRREALLIGLFVVAGTSAAPAQMREDGFGAQCGTAGTLLAGYCYRVAEAIQVVQPRVGIALSGGNPVMGTASTLGMRLGAMPRISVGLRASGVAVKMDEIENLADEDDLTFAVPAVSADVAVGLYSGLGLGPTVGGLGSLDLLGSIGTVPLPSGKNFDGSPFSWAAGARLGILRESFTAPGLSVSAMYRKVGEIEYGDPQLESEDAYFLVDDFSAWSLRGTVSKRLLALGLTAGAGYDRYRSGVLLRVADPNPLNQGFELSTDELESSRTTFFGNVALTMMILHLVGEVGWQSGGDPDFANQPQASTEQLEKGAIYGSVALRLTF